MSNEFKMVGDLRVIYMKMTKEKYLLNKLRQKRNWDSIERRVLCPDCRRSINACFCNELSPFNTKTHFGILMHPMEAKKEKVGTGRVAHKLLLNSEILEGVSFENNKKLNSLMNSHETWLLYPGESAIDLQKKCLPTSNRPRMILIIDGTWPCAKKMMKLSPCLHHLPRVSFGQQGRSQFHIKEQPMPGCLSTIESIHALLKELVSSEIEEPVPIERLLDAQQRIIDFQLSSAMDPSKKRYGRGNYSTPEQRHQSKRWKHWKIWFEKENYSKEEL